MAEVIRMPRLSDTMAEGKIVSWNKKVGDKIKAGDVLAEVETDKATMELESYNDGTLLHIGVAAGSAAKVDGVLAVVGKEGEDFQAALKAADGGNTTAPADSQNGNGQKQTEQAAVQNNTPAASPGKADNATSPGAVALPAGAKEIRMPLLSDTMTEGKIVCWNKKVGDTVKADDVLADVETDKATMEVVGYEEGTLLYIGVEAGSAAKINQIIAIVGKSGTDVTAYVAAEEAGTNGNGATPAPAVLPEADSAVEIPATNADAEAPAASNGRVKASPLAKKLAEAKGIDISRINGTGDNGRVVKKDVDSFKKEEIKPAAEPTPSAKQIAGPTTPAFAASGQESHTDVPVSQMRTVIARRLGESMYSAPHFYLTIEVVMDAAIAARTAINEVSPVKISFNDLLIKAVASALKLHPAVNSSWMGDFIRQNHHIHIGSAIALPEGLIVPVIKFADQKSLSQIATDAKQLYQKARDKKLQPAEFSGNTFTISNLGMMDIEEFTAIINPPDSCILAVGRIKEVVVRKDNEFTVANMMKLTLSCDHRSVDGAVGAAFLQTLKKFIEQPVTMLA